MRIRVQYFEKLECKMCDLFDYVEQSRIVKMNESDKALKCAHFRRHHGGLEP